MKTRRKNVSEDCLTIIQPDERSKISTHGGDNSESIPLDLILEILSRLPAKSVARCQCLSKLWTSMLRGPYFTEFFLARSYTRPQLLFACKKNNELFFYSSPQPQSRHVNSPPVIADHLRHFHFDGDGGYRDIIGHAHGLVCLRDRRIVEGRDETVLVICNPTTGQFLTLPKAEKVKFEGIDIYFGYDPIENQYKVLSMTVRKGHHILTLGTGNLSWRPVECSLPLHAQHKAICVNGVLYYKPSSDSAGTHKIVYFDFRSEKFSLMDVKKTFNGVVNYANGVLVNCNEKLGLFLSGSSCYVDGSSTSIQMWVLEDNKKQEWSEHKYVLPPLWQNTVEKTFLRFIGVTRSKEIVFCPFEEAVPFDVFYYNTEGNKLTRVFYYDTKVNKFTRVEIQGIEAFENLCVYIDHVENLKFVT